MDATCFNYVASEQASGIHGLDGLKLIVNVPVYYGVQENDAKIQAIFDSDKSRRFFLKDIVV